MNKAVMLPVAAWAVALAGCTTTATDTSGPIGVDSGPCQAGPGQSFVGQRATAEVGAQLLRVTGANQLRWGPPRSAMTMDFRGDRLTVSYGDDMMITRVACG